MDKELAANRQKTFFPYKNLAVRRVQPSNTTFYNHTSLMWDRPEEAPPVRLWNPEELFKATCESSPLLQRTHVAQWRGPSAAQLLVDSQQRSLLVAEVVEFEPTELVNRRIERGPTRCSSLVSNWTLSQCFSTTMSIVRSCQSAVKKKKKKELTISLDWSKYCRVLWKELFGIHP